MLERRLQELFFAQAIGALEINDRNIYAEINIDIAQKNFTFDKGVLDNTQNDRLRVYRDLVYHRFADILKNVYPLFQKETGDEYFEYLVRLFISQNPREPFIWKMPNEFRHFICNNKELIIRRPAAQDILLYEWTEVELLMGDYSDMVDGANPELSLDLPLAFSKSARKLKLSYRVYTGEFDTAGTWYAVLYYNFSDCRVYFMEITPFMNDLLEALEGKNGHLPAAVLRKTAAKYHVDQEEIGEVVFKTLHEYYQKKILVRA